MRIPNKAIMEKLKDIDKKLEQQKETQTNISLSNFGLTYTMVGLTIMITVLVAFEQDLFKVLMVGFAVLVIGAIFTLFSDQIIRIVSKLKKK